jgi:adenylate cyclase
MATEIERKFLVQGTPWQTGTGVRYCQGYLNRDKERTVRVRTAGDKAFLTIKGVTRGAARAEFEYSIPLSDAEQLLKLSDGPVIQKNRYVIQHDGSKWEVDEFLGDNAGLVVAEIELQAANQSFSRPSWLGREVTTASGSTTADAARHWRGRAHSARSAAARKRLRYDATTTTSALALHARQGLS